MFSNSAKNLTMLATAIGALTVNAAPTSDTQTKETLGTIRFTGQIMPNTCSITTKNSNSNINVPMGNVSIAALNSNQAPLTPFTLTFNGCTSAKKAKFKITSLGADNLIPIDSEPKNEAATGVAIAIYQEDGTTQVKNTEYIEKQLITSSLDLDASKLAENEGYEVIDENKTIILKATYKKTAAVTPGKANATANFTVTYE